MAATSGRARNPHGWVIGRVVGAPVVVSRGWAVSAVVIVLLIAPSIRGTAGGPAGYLLAAAAVLLLFGSTFLHELAHALVARLRGVGVQEISVTILGGHTHLRSAALTPGTSALVAVAGPLVNLAIGGAAWAAWTLLAVDGVVGLLILSIAVTNGFVGLLNLLPGLPLDGGRVLEAAVWSATGRQWSGTLAAGWIGRVLAIGVVAVAVVLPLIEGTTPDLFTVVWAAVVGAFLWTGATEAVRAGHADRVVQGLSVQGLMTPAVAIPASDRVADLAAVGDDAHDVVLLGPDGRVVGYVDRGAVAQVPVELRGSTPLSAVAVPLVAGAVVDGSLTGSAAVRAVAGLARSTSAIVVLGRSHEVVGLLRTQDVIAAVRAASGSTSGT